MIKIVVLGGTGDVYLVCALIEAFKRRHNRDNVQVVIEGKYACIAEMFGVSYAIDDTAIIKAEADPAMQRDYDNVIAEGRYFYAHPCFQRTHIRVDALTAKPDASQSDMYRLILRLEPDDPLALPNLPQRDPVPNSVVVITQSTSWPNNQPHFWDLLAVRLRQAGWHVVVNDLGWPLKELFQHCANAEWAIGPQCGVMSILTTGRFACRKTFVTANVDDNAAIGFLARQTYPYGYVTKFSNQDYDVDEFKVSDHDHDAVASLVVHSANALRLRPHDPTPVATVAVPLTPGDFLDRFAVLTVKRERFSLEKRAAQEREYQRHAELFRQTARPEGVAKMFGDLLELHRSNFELLEGVVPDALAGGGMSPEAHVAAVRNNKARIDLKRAIDEACHAPYFEGKSYYG